MSRIYRHKQILKMLPRFTFATLMVALLSTGVHADSVATVNSSEGWSVTVVVRYTGMTRTSSNNNCRYGFNYHLNYEYDITYSDGGGPRSWYLGVGGGCLTNGGTVGLNEGSALSGTFTSYNKYSNSTVNCNQVDPDDYYCEDMNLTISAPGISNQTVSMQYMDGDAALPVNLLSFSANKHADDVDLQWSTSFEEENDYFVVERSVDGQAWEPLASLPGQGANFPVSEYNFKDGHPATGANYYRLVQVAMDGTSTYSEIVSATFAGSTVSIFPNPAGDHLTVMSTETIEVFNGQGQQIPLASLSPVAGNGSYKLDLHSLRKGLYYIRTGNQVSKFLHE